MNLRKLTVRIRLHVGFGALALWLVGGVGVAGLLDLQRDAKLVVNTLFPNTYLANGTIHDVNMGARALRNALLVTDETAPAGTVRAARRTGTDDDWAEF